MQFSKILKVRKHYTHTERVTHTHTHKKGPKIIKFELHINHKSRSPILKKLGKTDEINIKCNSEVMKTISYHLKHPVKAVSNRLDINPLYLQLNPTCPENLD